ncbi:allantoate amidohydrolase [Vibrio palustris]|uniref:N-carbamoyl-L-amino acid hydrolase n=1 Tax=Vibrio palustris TaxID=1918946 RepID=A0A1R4B4L2_9VIBR|nr:allantoate amidohydrolase [Vibrio palustris]SJL83850.1 N-carbamoyl-L-amino acid hydrolase [Vibrio palustris]
MDSALLTANQIMDQADILATFSADDNGLTRAYLTQQHQQAHQQLQKWMQDAGLVSWEDSVGNQWGRKVSANPTQPTLIIGSHSDTVTNAGKYDGNLGVLLGIAALAQLRNVEFPFHIDVVAFADEEGTRFNTTLIGSSAVAGIYPTEWLTVTDSDGVTIGDAMRKFGLDPTNIASAARKASDVLAYLEVHIEQGPVLEANNRALGVVTGIAGAKRYEFIVKGFAGHAGTVPLPLRQDALCGAAEMIQYIESYASQHNMVATVGVCHTPQGAVNVIPGETRFTLDIRSDDQAKLDHAAQELLKRLHLIAEHRHLQLNASNIYDAPAVLCDETLRQSWGEAVETITGQTPLYLSSGAGHDGLAMASLTKVGMLFVRCEKGISHHPAESVNASDVGVALQTLVAMIESMQTTR